MALLLVATAPQIDTSVFRSSVPGTYDILICKAACTFSSAENVLKRGVVIFDAEPFPAPVKPVSTPFFPPGFDNDAVLRGGEPNSCFVLETTGPDPNSGGRIEVWFTRWSLGADVVHLRLGVGVDTSSTAEVNLTQEGFRGVAIRLGGIDQFLSKLPPEILAGHRTGSADRSICFKAAEKQKQP